MISFDFKNKNIALFVVETTIPPVSRANLRLYHLAVKLMKEKKFHVHMITPSQMPWTRKTTFLDKIIINQYWGFGNLIYSKIRIPIRAWHFVASVCSIIYLNWYFGRKHKKSIDVIHAWNPLAGLTAVISAKIIKSKSFVDFTDFYSDIAHTDLPLLSKILLKIEVYVLKNATQIFVVSEEMKNYLVSKLKLNKNKICIVEDGVDIKAFDYHTSGSDIRTQLGLTEKNPTLIFHGDIKYDDGLDILLDALSIALKKRPDIKLLVLGGGGAYFNKLKNTFKSLPLKHNVIYLGWIPYDLVSKYIGAADIGIMPIRSTLNHNLYLSFKLFEYWAMSKPVIVTKLKAISSIFKNGKTGIIIPNENPQKLAEAILNLTKNKRRAKKMGDNGRKLVEEKFNWEKIFTKEVDVYKKYFPSS